MCGSLRAQKACSTHFEAQLVHGKIHVLTNQTSEKVHKFGHDLFTGNTPVGKGLESVKGTPQHFFSEEGATKSDWYQLPRNLETIDIGSHNVGWHEIFAQAFDPIQLIL